MKTIKVYVSDFSIMPGGRYRSDGEYSGEEFRDLILLPLFQDYSDYNEVIVNLDGVEGFLTAFLEEAFGGLARIVGTKRVQDIIKLESVERPHIIKRIEHFIEFARFNAFIKNL